MKHTFPQHTQALLSGLFSFATEDRTECLETGAVSYRRSTSTHLALHVPLEAAVNAADVERYKERQVCFGQDAGLNWQQDLIELALPARFVAFQP